MYVYLCHCVYVCPGICKYMCMYVCVCVYNYVSVGMVRNKIVGYAYAERAPTTNKITIMCE